MARSRQSRIGEHFSPSSQAKRKPPPRRSVLPTRSYATSPSPYDSEGSEGLAGIQLTQAEDAQEIARGSRGKTRKKSLEESEKEEQEILEALNSRKGKQVTRQRLSKGQNSGTVRSRKTQVVEGSEAEEDAAPANGSNDDQVRPRQRARPSLSRLVPQSSGRGLVDDIEILEDPPGSFDTGWPVSSTSRLSPDSPVLVGSSLPAKPATSKYQRQRPVILIERLPKRQSGRILSSTPQPSKPSDSSNATVLSSRTSSHASGNPRSRPIAPDGDHPPAHQPNISHAAPSQEDKAANSGTKTHPQPRRQRVRPVVEIESQSPDILAAYTLFPADTVATAIDLTHEDTVNPVPAISSDDDDLPLAVPATQKPADERSMLPRLSSSPAALDVNESESSPRRRSISSRRTNEPQVQKAKRGARAPSSSGRTKRQLSSSSEADSAKELKVPRKNKTYGNKTRQRGTLTQIRRLKGAAIDPDEESSVAADDIDDLQLDEPERFKTDSRLRRRKETNFQRQLRIAKAKREGREISEDESEDETSHGERTLTSDSAPDSDADDFIIEDGGQVGEVALPHEFSSNVAQSPEFKFKVVFHYMVLLAVKGPKVLPLKGETAEYFLPFLADWRRRMEGHRDSRVRSQIWRSEFVRALKRYPDFVTNELDRPHEGCDACHMSGRRSKYEVRLEGHPYDPETHEPLETDSEEERQDERVRDKREKERSKRKARRGASSSESPSEDDEELPRVFRMGRFCKARASVYHGMTHWEDELYYAVRGYYHDLLRAKYQPVPSDSEASSTEDDTDEDEEERDIRKARRQERRQTTKARVNRLRRGPLVAEWRSVDKVTEWMDMEKGYQAFQYRWINDLITRSETLREDKGDDE